MDLLEALPKINTTEYQSNPTVSPIEPIYLIYLIISIFIVSILLWAFLYYLDQHKWDKEVLKK